MKTLFTLFCSIYISAAADITFIFPANPPEQAVTGYHVYEMLNTVWTHVGVSPTNGVIVMGVLPGVHTYSLTSSNGLGESQKSMPINFIMPSGLPSPINSSNVIIYLKASIEKGSTPSGPWDKMEEINLAYLTSTNSNFFRSKIFIYK